MGVTLLDQDQTASAILERMRSREWWAFCCDDAGLQVTGEFERRYYSGAAANDCEIFVLPLPGMPTLVFCRKSRMTPKQLHRILRRHNTPFTERDLLTRDFCLLVESAESPVARAGLAYMLAIWPQDGSMDLPPV